MSNIKISIIIPVYNVEEYINEALDSLVNQSFKDIEVIMVDDGSTDNSGKIMDEYATKYPNFHAYHKKNEGTSIARNLGMDKAKGEYIAFIDPDDIVPEDAYEKLYNYAQETGQEVILGKPIRFSTTKTFRANLYVPLFPENIENRPHTNIEQCPELVYDTGVWNKIIKKSLLDKTQLRFFEGVFSQDLLFEIKLHYSTRSVAILSDIVYCWRVRDGVKKSITQRKSEFVNLRNRFFITNEIYKFQLENKINDELIDAQYYKWLSIDFPQYIRQLPSASKQYRQECLEYLHDIIKKIPKHNIKRQKKPDQIKYNLILKKHYKLLLILLKTLKLISPIRKVLHKLRKAL